MTESDKAAAVIKPVKDIRMMCEDESGKRWVSVSYAEGLEAKLERLSKINRDLVRDHNALLVNVAESRERAEKAEASGGDKLRRLMAWLNGGPELLRRVPNAPMASGCPRNPAAFTVEFMRGIVGSLLAEPAEGATGKDRLQVEQPETCPEVLSWGVCAAPMPCKHHTPLSAKPADTERGEDDKFLRGFMEQECVDDFVAPALTILVKRELARGGAK